MSPTWNNFDQLNLTENLYYTPGEWLTIVNGIYYQPQDFTLYQGATSKDGTSHFYNATDILLLARKELTGLDLERFNAILIGY